LEEIMKKILPFFLLVSLAARQSPAQPQVTVTPQATITLTALPAPTLHPQFTSLQETIAASGGRFTLNADGLIYDSETPIPGLTVAPDDTMTLTVNGETITFDPAAVTFDDEKGIAIDGYELDENGAWVEAVTVLTPDQFANMSDEEKLAVAPDTTTITEPAEEGGHTSTEP
jgi:hypothetical protein